MRIHIHTQPYTHSSMQDGSRDSSGTTSFLGCFQSRISRASVGWWLVGWVGGEVGWIVLLSFRPSLFTWVTLKSKGSWTAPSAAAGVYYMRVSSLGRGEGFLQEALVLGRSWKIHRLFHASTSSNKHGLSWSFLRVCTCLWAQKIKYLAYSLPKPAAGLPDACPGLSREFQVRNPLTQLLKKRETQWFRIMTSWLGLNQDPNSFSRQNPNDFDDGESNRNERCILRYLWHIKSSSKCDSRYNHLWVYEHFWVFRSSLRVSDQDAQCPSGTVHH